ncbi:BamA/TamA family outer membrane protein [Spirosoma utsteinense]|uniref:Outer membrane protein assembly factor BamA n=1 Tax=Spirosoma utsteinense TaxID=2585773 RepID=A0ABR6W9L0_9BACT|nr:BamA/TamA family outer membrane protein [Spirosoma utsteinense]MBC3787663.1 outer membrane protein assembly factor BamA [Spirosoma utsteinense]MBC3793259.1 outer membrane protein assembly factor BamA [Spirosoma utsteinense]
MLKQTHPSPGLSIWTVLSLLLLACLLNACNIAKHLPANERLYMGTDVVVNADSTVAKVEQESMAEQLSALARPRPNAQLFGYPFRVGLYYLFGEPKKPKGFRSWFRKKFGREPVFASARAISANAPVMNALLQNEGYFGSTVSGSLKEEGYKARGVYQADMKQRYYVDSVAFQKDSAGVGVRPVIQALQASARRTIFKKGDPYRFDNIKLERERIGQALKQRGLYYFTPDYIGVLADNDSVRHRTTLIFYIKPDMPEAAGVPYSIRNIFIYPNYNLSTARIDTNKQQAYQSEERFNIVDSSRRFDPKLFRDVITVQPGTRYNSRQQDLTLSRLVNVGAFKFVRNRFDPDQQGDSAVLDVHYYLTPYPTKSVRLELDGTSRSNNFNGTQAILSWRNRNALRRAELLTLNANVGIEFQVGAGDQALTNYRYGLDAVLTFPRLVSPFRFQFDQRQALPKTNLTLGYQTIIRGDLYKINSFNTTFGYAWRRSQRVEHVFQPFNANYIFVPLKRVTNRFYETYEDPLTPEVVKRQYINILSSDQFILSSLYTFNYNSSPRSNSPTTFRLTANAEAAGNLASLLIPLKEGQDQKTILGVPFAQYLRFDADARLYRKLGSSLTWANRLFVGVGIPYGNSKDFQLPLTRQYFIGGTNSIRAFRPRAIGPGLYTRDTLRNLPLFQDGGGDIRLEANTELRQKFNKYIEGAVFVDAGNIWTYYPAVRFTTNPLEGQFRNDFYKQIAIGAGVGIRIDLSYFLVRLDLATPLRKPYKTNGSEWVIDQINFRSRDWRKQNLVFNIGIGYPF